MPEQLLNLLKICLLVLLYLFFLRVLRAVWAEVSVTNGASVIAGTDRRRFGRRRSTGGAAWSRSNPSTNGNARGPSGSRTGSSARTGGRWAGVS